MKLFRSGAFYAVLALAALILAARQLQLAARFSELQAWIRTLGAWGPAVYALFYAAATVLAVPGSVMTVAAGSMFGFTAGFLSVSAGSTAGAALSFLISRYAARDWVERRLSEDPRFLRLDRLVREHGRVIVAVTRLVPLFPFHLLNYGFGLTAIGFRTYVLWSWLCMMPGTILYVAGGEAVIEAIRRGRISLSLAGLIAVSLAVMIVLAMHLGKVIKKSGK